jgi:hypothetical protein
LKKINKHNFKTFDEKLKFYQLLLTDENLTNQNVKYKKFNIFFYIFLYFLKFLLIFLGTKSISIDEPKSEPKQGLKELPRILLITILHKL